MAAGDAYSAVKVLHHPERLAALRRGEQIVPTQVQVILSDLCNQDCSFCAYRMEGYTSNQLFSGHDEDGHVIRNPNRMIPHAKVREILRDCKDMGVLAIQYTGGGEPTVHPQHAAIFRETVDLGLDMALVTNGMRLSAEAVDVLPRATWLRVSLDAGCEETYAAVRRVPKAAFLRVIHNIGRVVRAREAARSDLVIGVGFVVTPENWTEIADAVRIAQAIGADNIRISAAFSPKDEALFEGFYEQAAVLAKEAAAQWTSRTFTVFNMFGDRLGDLRQHSPDYGFCGYQHFTTYIGGDQNVYRCCVTSYNEQGLIGSLREQSFRQLWEGEAKRRAFETFDARGCERCMFNSKNRLLNYALEVRPAHVNFV